MQRTQRNGIILFGFGGALALTVYVLSIYFFDRLLIAPFFSANLYFLLTEQALLSVVISFFPFFIMGLGIYLIFKPVLMMADQVAGFREGTKRSNSDEKKLEKEKELELQRIMTMSDEELHNELVSMKTVEHVLVPRLQASPAQDSKNPVTSPELAEMVKVREKIEMIEEEQKKRRIETTSPLQSV
jgi:hypothetical protein